MRKALMIVAMVAVIAMAGTASANPIVTSAAGYLVTWDGNVGDYIDQAVPDNLSLGGTAFSDGYLIALHATANLNDGVYGNNNGWITDSDSDNFCGIDLGAEYGITSVAWGRDNVTGGFSDRVIGLYTVQVTTAADPQTTGSWTTIGTVELQDIGTPFVGEHRRHRYDVSTDSGDPIPATGVRLVISDDPEPVCIDELEINNLLPPIPEPAGLGLIGLALLAVRKRRS